MAAQDTFLSDIVDDEPISYLDDPSEVGPTVSIVDPHRSQPLIKTIAARQTAAATNKYPGAHHSPHPSNAPTSSLPNPVSSQRRLQPAATLPGLFADTTTDPVAQPANKAQASTVRHLEVKSEVNRRQRAKGNFIYPPPPNPPSDDANESPAQSRPHDKPTMTTEPDFIDESFDLFVYPPVQSSAAQLGESNRASQPGPRRDARPPLPPINTTMHTPALGPPPPPPPTQAVAPPSLLRNPRPPLASAELAIPATTYSPPYLSPFLTTAANDANLRHNLKHPLNTHLSHLACSYFSAAQPPCMADLKRHAQALCVLITIMDIQSEAIEDGNEPGKPSSVLNFLPNLLEPYAPKDKNELDPIQSLQNTLPVTTTAANTNPDPDDSSPSSDDGDCPLANRNADLGEVLQHANRLLEILDLNFQWRGGILGVLPLLTDIVGRAGVEDMKEARESAEGTILGQWIVWTQRLVERVAALERDVVGLREVLGGERMVPRAIREEKRKGKRKEKERGKGKGKGKERARDDDDDEEEGSEEDDIVDQDLYLLAGLSSQLWNQLHDELDISETIATTREENARKRGFGADSFRQRGPNEAPDDGVTISGDITAWIECTSRIYRVQGKQTLFVVPAWEIRPGVEKVRQVEETPLVVSVPVQRERTRTTLPHPHPAAQNAGGGGGGGDGGGGQGPNGGGPDGGGSNGGPNGGRPPNGPPNSRTPTTRATNSAAQPNSSAPPTDIQALRDDNLLLERTAARLEGNLATLEYARNEIHKENVTLRREIAQIEIFYQQESDITTGRNPAPGAANGETINEQNLRRSWQEVRELKEKVRKGDEELGTAKATALDWSQKCGRIMEIGNGLQTIREQLQRENERLQRENALLRSGGVGGDGGGRDDGEDDDDDGESYDDGVDGGAGAVAVEDEQQMVQRTMDRVFVERDQREDLRRQNEQRQNLAPQNNPNAGPLTRADGGSSGNGGQATATKELEDLRKQLESAKKEAKFAQNQLRLQNSKHQEVRDQLERCTQDRQRADERRESAERERDQLRLALDTRE